MLHVAKPKFTLTNPIVFKLFLCQQFDCNNDKYFSG
jgi:hypothetical protein